MPICRQKYSSCWRHLSFYACPFFPSLFYIHARLLRNVQSPLGAEELTGSKDLSPRFGRPGQPGWGGPSGRVCNGDHRTRACQGGHQFSSVQSLSGVRLFAIPWIAARQASLSITNSWSLPKLMSIASVMPSNHLILCRPLLLLPPIPPSIRVFSNESTLRMSWPKYWTFSFSISPSKEHPGLISFRMDWLDLLAVQGTLKSLLQHHSSKASILRCSAFLIVQLSHPHMTTGKMNEDRHVKQVCPWCRNAVRQAAPTPTGRLASQTLA